MVKRWAAWLAVVAGVLALSSSPRAADVRTPIVSGLPWRSGASVDDPYIDFGRWRRRPIDVDVVFIGHRTWNEMRERITAGTIVRQGRSRAPLLAVSLALLPHEARKRHRACANGDFDHHFRAFGAGFVRQGAGDAIVRLGWEANIGSDSHPWGIDGMAEVPAYKECFRRAVRALRSAAPSLRIEWAISKRGTVPALLTYPGNDVVDVWGFHYYDSGPKKTTQEIWDRYVAAGKPDDPWGIAAFLTEARKHGKKMSVPEWGVWDRADMPGDPDNPRYIENMYRFFKANAAHIAYENYYNRPAVHQLFPSERFPKARATYQDLWSQGQ
jgi:hypothetical protein